MLRQLILKKITFFSDSFSPTDAHAPSHQEGILCAKSSLRILRAVSSFCKFNLLLECLRSIETWINLLEKIAVLEYDDPQTFKEMEKVVVESFDVVNVWLKKSLSSKIPCYTAADTNEELQVCKGWCT